MKLLLALILTILPLNLMGQQVIVSRLGDNLSNESTTIEASANVFKLKNTRAMDTFGITNSSKVLLSFNNDTSGVRLSYDLGLGILAADTISQVYPLTTVSLNLPHKWNNKNPFSLSANASYAPLDDIARFSRSNVGVGTFSGNAEIFLRQRMWLRTQADYKMFTDSNRRTTSTFNARYFSSNGIIYGGQFYKQKFEFDANTNQRFGYWSPESYTSETVELGYKRPWNSKITGQVIMSVGYQQINRDNSPIASIQSDIRTGPISIWGNYSSNGAISGIRGYKWWTIGTSLKF